MIILCEECGKKYQLDPARIKGPEARFACKACGHLITVAKPRTIPKKSMPLPAAAPTAGTQVSRKPAAADSKTENLALPEKSDKKKLIPAQFMRTCRFRWGLTAKIFSLMVLVGLIPLIMFWGIALSQVKERIRIGSTQRTAQLFASMVRYVDEWFGEKEKSIKALAETNAMVSMDPALQESVLSAAFIIDPHLENLFVVDAGGKYFAGRINRDAADYSEHSFPQNLLSSPVPLWRMLRNTKTGKPVLMLTVPIKTPAGAVGGIVLSIENDKISKQIIPYEASHIGFAFLVKRNQTIDAYPIADNGFKQQPFNWSPLIGAYRNGQWGGVSFQNLKGEAVLGYVDRTKFGWGIAIQKDEIEASLLMNHLMSSAYLLLVVIIVTVSIIAWFSGRAISKPIIKLTDAANRISIGELDMEIRTKRKDEIGDLSDAIARMQDSIRIAIERLRRRS